MALTDLSKTELANRLASTRKRYRETTMRSARVAMTGLLGAGGGVAATMLAHYMPRVPQTSVPADAAFGVILLGASAADMFDGAMNEQVAAFAGGLLAVAAARETDGFLRTRKAAV